MTFDDLLADNRRFAAGFRDSDLPAAPTRKLAVVTCMDARLHPEKFLGLAIGDAHVIRNAGGRVTDDVIRSLAVSQSVLGTNAVVLIQHTDCGMQAATDEQISARVRERTGTDPSHVDFLTFSELEQNVRDDVHLLRTSELIPKDVRITGAIYQVRSGRVEEVIRA